VLPPQAASRPAVIAISRKKLARLLIELVLLTKRGICQLALSAVHREYRVMGASQPYSTGIGRALIRAKVMTKDGFEEP
jgi:hypothetical protein